VLKTVQGGTLTVMANVDKLVVEDAKGGVANVSITNVMQSNGVFMSSIASRFPEHASVVSFYS
jgi:hypothetical protein